VGPKTVRALALASELVHGAPASLRDPARFAFAHGGKDGTPFPVDRETYDRTIEVFRQAINRAADRPFRESGRFQAAWRASATTPARIDVGGRRGKAGTGGAEHSARVPRDERPGPSRDRDRPSGGLAPAGLRQHSGPASARPSRR
jgi:hypothetical protein